jgi:hypothetical protein
MSLLALPPESATRVLQERFANHLRDPAVHAAPAGLEDRRLQIYRDLFYNNVEDFLATACPVIRKLSSDAVWHARVRDFYARHRCTEPQFFKLAEEFLRFLESGRGPHPDDPPFLSELAHYEWVELALSISEAELTPDLADPNGDLVEGAPRLSPLAWAQAYAWPVQKISPDIQPQALPEQPTYLVVYRTRQDDVRFMEINAVTARLLQLIEEQPAASGRELLLQIAAEIGHPEPAQIVEADRKSVV